MTVWTGRRRWLAAAVVVAVAGILAIYAFFSPVSGLFPRCVFNVLTGLKCPGCGTQRGIHALLAGNIISAVRFNAMLLPGIVAFVVFLVSETMPRRFPKLSRALRSRRAAYILVSVILVWWVGRNWAGI